jgi:hypothetical protein
MRNDRGPDMTLAISRATSLRGVSKARGQSRGQIFTFDIKGDVGVDLRFFVECSLPTYIKGNNGQKIILKSND